MSLMAQAVRELKREAQESGLTHRHCWLVLATGLAR